MYVVGGGEGVGKKEEERISSFFSALILAPYRCSAVKLQPQKEKM